VQFGLFTKLTNTDWPSVLRLWRHAEQSGWDAACVTDHFSANTVDGRGETLECWTTLASLALAVPRIRVGTIVSANTFRHPAVVAKMATTIDVISGGRLICGIGAGWQENEHHAYGIPFYTLRERLARLEESCAILKALWMAENPVSFRGRYYEIRDARLMPKPVQRPSPPLMVGGGGEKVTVRIAARYGDHWNIEGGPSAALRKAGILLAHCQAIGRDFRDIVRSVSMPLFITNSREQRSQALTHYMQLYGAGEEVAADGVLFGDTSEITDKIARLQEAGVGMVFVMTSWIPGDPRSALDRFKDSVESLV
jgi:F420-dependent oxidoreductase-like protein